jgi:hypothetical protein
MSITRALLFWVGCIGVRSAGAWLAYAHPRLLPYLGVVAAAIAIGFITIYLGGLRPTGVEVSGERIWWNSLRPVHAILYGVFAYMACNGHPEAWKVLAADVALGAGSWIFHRM